MRSGLHVGSSHSSHMKVATTTRLTVRRKCSRGSVSRGGLDAPLQYRKSAGGDTVTSSGDVGWTRFWEGRRVRLLSHSANITPSALNINIHSDLAAGGRSANLRTLTAVARKSPFQFPSGIANATPAVASAWTGAWLRGPGKACAAILSNSLTTYRAASGGELTCARTARRRMTEHRRGRLPHFAGLLQSDTKRVLLPSLSSGRATCETSSFCRWRERGF